MRTLLILAGILLLSACSPTPEQKANAKAMLPVGCQIHDLGSYGSVSHLVVVWCPATAVTTSNYSYHAGKSSRHISVVSLAGTK
jgi:hypothetical protein